VAGRRRRQLGGTVVLDAEGVVKAARADRRIQALLTSARNRDARVVVSAVTLAEILRGSPRDAAFHQILHRSALVPVSVDIGRSAGSLLGSTGMSGATIDAIVAATAAVQPRPVLLLTSDPGDLARLTGDMPDVVVVPV